MSTHVLIKEDWMERCNKCQVEFCVGWWKRYGVSGPKSYGHTDKDIAIENLHRGDQSISVYYCKTCAPVVHVQDCEPDANDSCYCGGVFTCGWCMEILPLDMVDQMHEKACETCCYRIRILIKTPLFET